MKEVLQLVQSAIKAGCRFVSFTYTAKGSGEVAKHTVLLGVKYIKALKRDIAIVKAMKQSEARDEVLASLEKSLAAHLEGGVNEDYTRKDENRIDIGQNVKLVDSGFTISAFSVSKHVILQGVHKAVKSSEKTLAKNAIRRHLRTGKFREYCLTGIQSARIDGKTLVLE